MIADRKIWDCLSFSDAKSAEVAPPQHENLEALIEQAHALWKKGKRDEAIVLFNQAAAIDASYVQCWLDRAKERYLNLLQRASSIETYNRTLDSAPARARAWSRLANGQLSSRERWEQALSSYDQLLAVQPENHLAWYYRGDALLELQRCSEAIASFGRAIATEPRAKGGWMMRVRKLLRIQRIKEAIALCSDVSACLRVKASASDDLSPELRQEFHESWQQLGNYFYKLEQCKEAVAAYKRAIAFNAEDIETWLARAAACENLRRYGEAIECYNRVLAIQPGHVKAEIARDNLRFYC